MQCGEDRARITESYRASTESKRGWRAPPPPHGHVVPDLGQPLGRRGPDLVKRQTGERSNRRDRVRDVS